MTSQRRPDGCADDLLLPSTSWGRPLKPHSKRMYQCSELKETITYTDLDGSHLVQLRVGLQDMVPPSIHPKTGEKSCALGFSWTLDCERVLAEECRDEEAR